MNICKKFFSILVCHTKHFEKKNSYDKQKNLHILIYCKYWIFNRTEFALYYYSAKSHLGAFQGDQKRKKAISPCFFFSNLILKNIDEKQARNLSDFTFEWYKQHALQEKVVKPFLFSFRKASVGSQKAFIQIENSHLSEGLNIDSLQVTKHYQAYFLKFHILLPHLEWRNRN